MLSLIREENHDETSSYSEKEEDDGSSYRGRKDSSAGEYARKAATHKAARIA